MSAAWKYAFEGYDKDNMARAAGVYMTASFKYLREACRFIRGKLLIRAISELEEITEKKRALPLSKYNKDIPHKKAIGPGRYPVDTIKSMLVVLRNVLANAKEKGLNESKLKIIHSSSSKAMKRRKMTNFEVVVAEAEEKKKKSKKPENKKEETKKEAKKEPAKKEVKGDKE